MRLPLRRIDGSEGGCRRFEAQFLEILRDVTLSQWLDLRQSSLCCELHRAVSAEVPTRKER